LICFSTVIPLAATPSTSPEGILKLTELPPLERLRETVEDPAREEIYERLLELYAWFLDVTAKVDLTDWIGDKANRTIAFAKADEFGILMFSLLKESVGDANRLRFLII
jgi:hypothetical protein